MTYSLDFRRKVLAVKEEERLTYAEAAERFAVAKNSILLWSKDIEPKKSRNKPATKIDMEALKRDVAAHPDAYQYERAERFCVTSMGICRALKRLNVTYKKNLCAPQGVSRRQIYVLQESQ